MKKYTTDIFIKKAREVHGDKYNYDKVEYINSRTKVCIICPEHGEFWQTPDKHLHSQGCPKCGNLLIGTKLTSNKKEFINKARKIHRNKYDYSKVKYMNNHTKVCIICPEHGEFWQTPGNHLSGNGCPKCNKNFHYNSEEFIKKAREVHGDKYNYDKVEYINNFTKVTIICPKHGEFEQTPGSHLMGCGCRKCSIEINSSKQKSNTKVFIKKAIKVHGNKYDYSKVEYINSCTKVCIICPEHGEFWQTPDNHLRGQGCPKCGGNLKSNTEEFLNKAKEIHGNKYDYSKVEYINYHTKVCIICPEHGEFWQTPANHLSGNGCPKCANNIKYSTHNFIQSAIKVHGDKYDYSKVEYMNNHTKVCIICPEHGEFWQTPYNHLSSKGCPKCGNLLIGTKLASNKKEFINKAKEIHGNKYDYSKVEYMNSHTKVCIICPEHGEFWQTPNSHLSGVGCPKCIQSNLEKEVEIALKNNNIDFIPYYKPFFLKTHKGYSQHLDFFIPSKNIAIECQGVQHYKPVDVFGGEIKFEKTKALDQRKRELCKNNNVKLLYYTSEEHQEYDGFDSQNTFTNINKLLDMILS